MPAALKDAARSGGHVFAILVNTARVCRLQQITDALFEGSGQHCRNI